MANGILDGYEFDSDLVCPMGTDRATGERVQLSLSKFNRHGIVTGATGTGKTRTIQQMLEWLSQHGVPSVMADGKGDMSGMATEGTLTEKSRKRMASTDQVDWWEPTSIPVQFLALGGKGEGTAVRTTVGSYGYKSLAKLIGLSPAQSNALGTVFLTARRDQYDLIEIEDLKNYLRIVRDDPDSSISSGVCNRVIDALNLFEENNPGLFGGPEFDVMDLIRDDDGWGMVSLIDSSQLQDNPEVLTTFLLWLLEKLTSALPEVGDLEIPKLVFFFDEAHLMFTDAPKEFIRGILKTVKRIRSKGVGIFFISQSAADIPDSILEQCANRIQHAVRANTPQQLRELKKTADTFPLSARYDILSELTSMAIGEALVCVIDDDGRPTPPAVTLIYVPRSSMEPMDEDEIRQYTKRSLLQLKYLDMEREWNQSREASAMPPEPVLRVREATPPPNPLTRSYSPRDAVPVGVLVDDGWGM